MVSVNPLYPRHPRSVNPHSDMKTALTQKKAGDKITACLSGFQSPDGDFSLTAASGSRRGFSFRRDRPGVHCGWPWRVSGSARDEENLHLTAVDRNAAGAHRDAVDVDLDVEAAVGQTVARVLGALHVEAGRTLHISAITVDDE